MNLNHRVKKLEDKLRPGNGVYAIELRLGEGETEDQAKQRYCSEKGIPVEDLDNLGPDSMVIFLIKSFPDQEQRSEFK